MKKSGENVFIGAVFITFVEILQMNRMRKYNFVAAMMMIATLWCSCDDVETYAEMKEKEKANIEKFIKRQGVKVITENQFKEKGYVTDTARNEFVLFESSGVYMQIVRRGEGKMMEDGERKVFLVRYFEQNIQTGETLSTNYYQGVDKLTCKREDATYTASFTEGYMLSTYGSSAVPNGWLVPFNYITPGRPNDKGAKVRLIVPHDHGTSIAAQYVYPTYYEITYIPESL